MHWQKIKYEYEVTFKSIAYNFIELNYPMNAISMSTDSVYLVILCFILFWTDKSTKNNDYATNS